MALDQWPIFSLLDPAFFQGIKLAAVYGTAGNEALIVTNEDEVYALGSNTNGCLGVGDCNSTLLPRKVLQLCKKGMCTFNKKNYTDVISLSPTMQESVSYPMAVVRTLLLSLPREKSSAGGIMDMDN